jgi:glycogen operon protein
MYGFRVHGPFEPSRGQRFNPAKLLIDPRALAVTGEPPLDGSFCGSSPDNEAAPDSRNTGILAPKSIVVDRTFDWQGDSHPATDWRDTILYECHVRGTSIRHPYVAAAERGTYLGLASEPILDHLERLGITAVELLPVQQIASEPHLLRHELPNYFGYSPLAFFAPHAGYATGNLGEQVTEFKQMVRAFHRRGIEVILDLVLNHTAEGGRRGRTLSLRGIDNRTYYRLEPDDPCRYVDFTGCGNSLATQAPRVTELLVDCLRYWVEDMHVDGFRFDLAVTLGRTAEGFSPGHPLFETIANDPRFNNTKLIAEPWDLGPGGYQRGKFPAGWLEWDDRFRDTARKVWRGDTMGRGDMARLFSGFGSESPSSAAGDRPGIHFITCHDGFTLEDLVSYENKHNWANREENRDGHNHNLSRNWGTEGPTDLTEILERRIRAKRNLLATMFLTPGVPMLSHGDELNRTQQGNNNAYCQDNELARLEPRACGQ